MSNRKTSELVAATALTAAVFPIAQAGASLQAPIALLDARYGNTNVSASDPTVNSDIDAGYYPGSRWVNSTTGNLFTCISNGDGAARWRCEPRHWASTAESATLTGTTNETVLATLSLPGGLPGLNGVFEIHNSWEVNNDASGKTGATKIGAMGAGVAATQMRGTALGATVTFYDICTFKNANSQSAQRAFNTSGGSFGIGSGGSASLTAAINTSAAFDIVWTGTLTDGADTLILRNWFVTLTRPDIAP